MRLIGDFKTEKEAYLFYSFLLKEGIENIYEPIQDAESGKRIYHVWVMDEDAAESAQLWLTRYRENPQDPQFQNVPTPLLTPSEGGKSGGEIEENLAWNSRVKVRILPPRFRFTLTHFLIALCAFLFLWNDTQETKLLEEKGPIAVQIGLTPLQESMLFDVPRSMYYIQEFVHTYPLESYKELKDLPPEAQALLHKSEEEPAWRGVYDLIVQSRKKGWNYVRSLPMFEKEKQGELWRLFTPTLLHRDFLHILFNMAWLWVLGRQIEQRLKRWKVLLLILVIGVVSNVFQYLMSGPYFLGFSGVVVGMAGFIWMRQKQAPWEGYPLQRATLLFILFFVGAMFGLELIVFFLQLFKVTQVNASIANTAHIVGGLTGMLLGRLPLFSRGKKP